MERIKQPDMNPKKREIEKLRADLKVLLDGTSALVIDLEKKDQSSLPSEEVADIMIDARENAGDVEQYLEGEYRFYKKEELDRTLFYIQLDK